MLFESQKLIAIFESVRLKKTQSISMIRITVPGEPVYDLRFCGFFRSELSPQEVNC